MSQAIDLAHLPDTYELPKANWKLFLMLGVALGLFVMGFTVGAEGEVMRGLPFMLLFAVFFAAVIGAIFMRTSIVLDREGFTYNWLFGGKRYAWRDVSDVAGRHVGRSRMILFNDASKVDTPLSKLSRAFRAGYNSGIAAAFVGGKLDDACAIMNAFRARALRRGA